jgi:hypothetical protein
MLVEIAVSLAGVAVTVFAAWALMRGVPRRRIDSGEAERIAEAALAGFVAEAAVVDGAARTALVRGSTGIAVLKPVGDDWAVRLAPRSALRIAAGQVTVATGEPMFGEVRLSVDPAAARALAGA